MGDYENLDLILRPDEPVAGIGQLTYLPEVSFENPAGLSLHQELIETAKRYATPPLSIIATNNGYRMRCARLPKDRHIDVVMAIVSIASNPDPNINAFDSRWVLAFNFGNGRTSWLGYSNRPETVFGPRPVPKSIQIDGEYTTGPRKRYVSQRLEIRDPVNDLSPSIPSN